MTEKACLHCSIWTAIYAHHGATTDADYANTVMNAETVLQALAEVMAEVIAVHDDAKLRHRIVKNVGKSLSEMAAQKRARGRHPRGMRLQ